jgi:hypothetical protein
MTSALKIATQTAEKGIFAWACSSSQNSRRKYTKSAAEIAVRLMSAVQPNNTVFPLIDQL